DLKTLPGDAISQALGINNWRQVVGISCTAGFASCRGFLCQNGVMTDLNTRVAPGYTDQIYAAGDINDLGRITGQAFNPASGVFSAFLAVPQRGQAGEDRAAGAQIALPSHLRDALQRRLGLDLDDR